MPDGTPAIAKELAWFATGKLSYQMSQANRLVGFYQYNHKYDTSNLSQFIPWEARGGLMTPSRTAQGRTAARVEQPVRHLGAGRLLDLRQPLLELRDRAVPPSLDLVTQQNVGPQTTIGQRPHNPRYHYKANATWYKPELFHGSHEFKTGFDYTDNWFGRQYPLLDPDSQLEGAYDSWVWTYRLRQSNGFASCRVAAGATTPCRDRNVEQPGRGQGRQPLLRDLSDGQLDGHAPRHAEPWVCGSRTTTASCRSRARWPPRFPPTSSSRRPAATNSNSTCGTAWRRACTRRGTSPATARRC